jgi:transcriptional regulator with XRE-family HTH domain
MTTSNIAGIAESLKSLRSVRRITGEQLAQMTGISYSTIANIESGRKKDLSVTELAALSEALKVEPYEIAPILKRSYAGEVAAQRVRAETYLEVIGLLTAKAAEGSGV